MQMRQHMAHILKFVNVIIIFLLIFVVVIDGIVVTGKFNFQIYFQNLFLILYTMFTFFLYSFFLFDITEIIKCESNKECRKQMPDCKRPKMARCVSRTCKCW